MRGKKGSGFGCSDAAGRFPRAEALCGSYCAAKILRLLHGSPAHPPHQQFHFAKTGTFCETWVPSRAPLEGAEGLAGRRDNLFCQRKHPREVGGPAGFRLGKPVWVRSPSKRRGGGGGGGGLIEALVFVLVVSSVQMTASHYLVTGVTTRERAPRQFPAASKPGGTSEASSSTPKPVFLAE